MRKITKEELGYLVIDHVQGVRTRDKHVIMNFFESGENVIDKFSENIDELSQFASPKAVEFLSEVLADRDSLKKFYDSIRLYDCDIVVYSDENYPDKLKELDEPPFVLYYRGNIRLLSESLVFIAGTRSVTSYGVSVTKTLVKALCDNGLLTLTGISDGVDTIAIETALAEGTSAVVSLAGGLECITPSINADLVGEVVPSGLVFSEFMPSVVAMKHHYYLRNRILAMLGDASVLVEAAENSNATNAVALSSEYGKEVFAVPGNLTSSLSKAPNLLIANDMARCLVDPRQIVESFQREYVFQPMKNVILSEFEQRVTTLLDKEPLHFDILCEVLQVDSGTLLGDLLMLEAKGVVKKLAGNFYSKPF